MSSFILDLKKESELIQFGLELLQAYRVDFEGEKPVAPADLRIALFAMQTAFENSHLSKEKLVLYPALLKSKRWHELPPSAHSDIRLVLEGHDTIRNSLLELRIALDDYERDTGHKGLLGWRLESFVDQTRFYLRNENEVLYSFSDLILSPSEQKSLASLSQSFDGTHNLDQSRAPFIIFNRLRRDRGMHVA